MNILVIGGCGYLGSKLLIQQLYNSRIKKLTVVDDLIFNQGHLIANILLNPYINFINCDVEDIPNSVIDKADVIYLLAAYVGGPLCDKYPDEAHRVNLEYPELLVQKLKGQRLIYTCSSSGYGAADTLCDETTPMKSISLYGQFKEEAEKIVMSYKNSTSIRLATVWGNSPRHRFDLLINDLTWKASKFEKIDLYQGNYKRCYIHINDVVELLDSFATNKQTAGEIFNAAGENCTKTELVSKIKRFIPKLEISYSDKEDPDKRCYFLNCDKIKNFGYSFKRTINNSLQDLIKYYNILEPEHYYDESMKNI